MNTAPKLGWETRGATGIVWVSMLLKTEGTVLNPGPPSGGSMLVLTSAQASQANANDDQKIYVEPNHTRAVV